MARYLVAVQLAGNQFSHQVLVEAETTEAARQAVSVAGTVQAVYEYISLDALPPVEVPDGFWNQDPADVRRPRPLPPALSWFAIISATLSFAFPLFALVSLFLGMASLASPAKTRGLVALLLTLLALTFWAILAANGLLNF